MIMIIFQKAVVSEWKCGKRRDRMQERKNLDSIVSCRNTVRDYASFKQDIIERSEEKLTQGSSM